MYRSKGRIVYDPETRVNKEDWWCIIRVDPELVKYYQNMITQRYDVEFAPSIWGSHISVVTGTLPKNIRPWRKYQGEEIEFTYDGMIHRSGPFFYINVQCEKAEHLRRELKLSSQPWPRLHLAVGRVDKKFFNLRRQQLKEFCDKLGIEQHDNTALMPLFRNNSLQNPDVRTRKKRDQRTRSSHQRLL